jgi:hypothetical protein
VFRNAVEFSHVDESRLVSFDTFVGSLSEKGGSTQAEFVEVNFAA